MTPEIALEYINAAKKSAYKLDNQFSGGENQGAYRVVGDDGKGAVLKISANPMWRKQIERAKAATNHLRPLGYPVPNYLYVDATDSGTFWLENEMSGTSIMNPSAEQAQKLVDLIEMQKGQVISEVQGQDWSSYVRDVTFRGEDGLVRVLMQYSNETSALAAQIEGMVLGLDGKVLAQSDLVHADFGISQVLAQDGQISAVLDWDQVGYGDRTMDLTSLWYSLIDAPAARDAVFERLTKLSDPQAIKVFAAYKMLALIAWHINRAGGEVSTVSEQTKSALQILHGL